MQVAVGAGDEQVLDRVFLFGRRAGQALAAAVLGPIGRQRRALHHRALPSALQNEDLAAAAGPQPPIPCRLLHSAR